MDEARSSNDVSPGMSLPRGGSVRGVDEMPGADPGSGAASYTIPLPMSPGRGGFTPALALAYGSGGTNGPFGFGFSLGIPHVGRRTDHGVPRYEDATEGDRFVLGGGDELVPALVTRDGAPVRDTARRTVSGATYDVARYRLRIEGPHARIERWTDVATGISHWRTISPGNVTTRYGFDPAARIADPNDPRRIASWLADRSADDRGNVAVYEYKAEDGAGVDFGAAPEAHRAGDAFAQRYLKRVRYGNVAPGRDDAFLFEVVFDYGEHDDAPPAAPVRVWSVRPDAFSTYRDGFEVRTYRLCRRVLMYHRFPELGDGRTLVRSLALAYDGDPVACKLLSATTSGHLRDGAAYTSASAPPVQLGYTPFAVHDRVRALPPSSLENAPSFGAARERWIDLYREGLPGLLSQRDGAWYYKRNLGGGTLAPLVELSARPGLADDEPAAQDLMDLDGDGFVELVTFEPGRAGMQRLDDDGRWGAFTPFASFPSIALDGADVRAVDLDGDGRSDLLVAREHEFAWYRSLGAGGFAPGDAVPQALDEERGPVVGVAEPVRSIFFADMSGDGLADVVRIRNGDVAYWPNLGHGRFGRKVAMAGAPAFDDPASFDPRRIRLADVDGSGCADVLYLGRDGAALYRNCAGNALAAPIVLHAFPAVDDLTRVEAIDLLGSGTACLVWTTALPAQPAEQLAYVDLLGSKKPHLLERVANGYGRETTFAYASSTSFMLADEAAGQPWVTRMPLAVNVVERVETYDHVTRHRFASRTTYHHGHYDRAEREFAGFGRVDRYDSETVEEFVRSGAANAVEADVHEPPVLTRTWHHTGTVPSAIDPVALFAREWFRGGAIGAGRAQPAPPGGLSLEEWVEHQRALRGAVLRTEVYGGDATPAALVPYSVSESTYAVTRVQPRGPNRHAVFQAHGVETLAYQCERDASDPRVSHTVNLAVDELGHVTRAVTVSYPRRTADPALPADVRAAQARLFASCAETDFTADVEGDDVLRRRAPAESRGYDVTGIAPAGELFAPQELAAALAGITEIAFEATPGAAPARRLVSRARRYFLADDLSGPLPLGTLGSLGLMARGVSLAFTAGHLRATFGARADDATMLAAGYVHDGDDDWWAPTSTPLYAPDAAAHFYTGRGARDPFGHETTAAFDGYDLLPVSTTDALGTTACVNDYRLLRPALTTDRNGMRTAVTADELGFVTRTAVLGRDGLNEGDTLADPTIRFEYDLGRWLASGRPNVTRTIARERYGDPATPWHTTHAYLDGGGAVVMTKIAAEPGLAKALQPDGTVLDVDTTPAVRWVGNGRTVLNNKGNPIRSYEPYFSVTPEYEDAPALVELGVSPAFTYDPLGRAVRTDFPDGTFTTSSLGTWVQRQWDPNDVVLQSAWYAERGAPAASGPEPADPQARAAWLAAAHANTPGAVHVDALGRAVYAVADNGAYGTAAVRIEADGPGTVVRAYDPLGRMVSASAKNAAGAVVASASMERPPRLVLSDVRGAPVRAWDGDARAFRYTYDVLRRPVALYEQTGAGEAAISVTIYGDAAADASARNLRGRAHVLFDQAGMATIRRYDLGANPVRVERRYARSYAERVDWSAVAAAPDLTSALAAAEPLLETETWTTRSTFDAMNRATSTTLPDGTACTPSYDAGSQLARLDVAPGGGAPAAYVTGQSHDARGRRLTTVYGNGTVAAAAYDPRSSRLTGLRLTRTADRAVLQDLAYVYDPVGNVVASSDGAQPALYFRNAVVPARSSYVYDALYQLRSASGRERAGGLAGAQPDWTDLPADAVPHDNDAAAVRVYTQTYEYDAAGNITRMRHAAAGAGWTRWYAYESATNRLRATSVPGDPDAGPYSAAYAHDAFGNMTKLPHLAQLDWNAYDQLRRVDLGGGGVAYYVYAANGQRTRKVIERGGRRVDRLQLGLLEVHREYSAGTLALERHTVHVTEAGHRIAQIDVKTADTNDPSGIGAAAVRYYAQDALGSATLVTDETGAVVSREEYHPYGTTAYRSSRNDAETSLKRYRYLDRERDEETGFLACGVRSYAPWLGRWTSADPGGFVDGLNLYRYAHNSPATLGDPSGFATKPPLAPPKGPKEGMGPINPPEANWHVARHVIPATVTTPARFETWARKNGLLYTGKPSYNPANHMWTVATWKFVARGKGGLKAPPAAGAPAAAASSAPPAPVRVLNGGDPANPTQRTAVPEKTGEIAYHDEHSPTEYLGGVRTPGNRVSENEHLVPGAQLEEMQRNPATGKSLYTWYEDDVTGTFPRGTSLVKTNEGPNADNAITAQLQNGRAMSWPQIRDRSAGQANFAIAKTGAPIPEETVNTLMLAQEGEAFASMRMSDVLAHLPPAPPPGIAARVWGSLRSSPVLQTVTKTTVGIGVGLARNVVMGFAEVETGMADVGLWLSATAGDTALGGLGTAMAAAPAAATTVVFAGGTAGYFVGDAVQEAVTGATGSHGAGAAAGIGSAALTGALVGAAIGSIVPGLGTAAGAVIGGAAGAIGGAIAAFW